jgi:hypothetical protein
MSNIPPSLYFISVGVCAGISAMYSYGTKFEKKITIEEKFERVQGGKNSTKQVFSIYDTENNAYQVNRSLWYWKWYSTELWNGLKKGETYNVTGYGLRCGMISLYPNIIEAKLCDNCSKDSYE